VKSDELEEGVGGVLAELQARHCGSFQVNWEVRFGDVCLPVEVAPQLDLLESLWVFIIDLVDLGYGEWSLHDGRDLLVFEAQVFGPDVHLEFGGEAAPPRYAGIKMPGRALVRLRRLVEQGAGVLRDTLGQQQALEPGLVESKSWIEFCADLDAIESAVAHLPAVFKKTAGQDRPPLASPESF
tara:strand:+ start:1708 stop:2256 length:549 start_codon:yes stop_codon:yes gene_type:complete